MARAAKKAAPKKRGAKPKYVRATFVPKICGQLLDGKPMAVICRELKIPVRTVNQWRQEDAKIAEAFTEAFEAGMHTIAYDCMRIADDGRRDYTEDKDGRKVVDHDHIQRSKLRVETRMKLLARWAYALGYGEKVTLAGDKDNPLLPPAQLTEAQLLAIAARGVKDDGADG